jgi:hypothetical protein
MRLLRALPPVLCGTKRRFFRGDQRRRQRSVYNQGQSINSGFAVDVWRPNPFGTGTDAFTNATLNNLFSGIQVDVAVRDTDAWLYRVSWVSYNITLLGKIVFGQVIIT